MTGEGSEWSEKQGRCVLASNGYTTAFLSVTSTWEQTAPTMAASKQNLYRWLQYLSAINTNQFPSEGTWDNIFDSVASEGGGDTEVGDDLPDLKRIRKKKKKEKKRTVFNLLQFTFKVQLLLSDSDFYIYLLIFGVCVCRVYVSLGL